MTVRAGRALPAVLLTVLLAGLLAGCADYAADALDADPTEDVVSAVRTDPAIAATLPPDVRAAGRLVVATSAKGSPPIRYYPDGGGDLIGVEMDLQQAVGRVLGVRMEHQDATFDEIIPAIRSGRFDIGQGSFGVTEERKKQVDFVTYYDDGFGILVRANRVQPPVREPLDLCGLTIGTTAGTSFEQVLSEKAGVCAQHGRPDYQIAVYRATADAMLALNQSKMDVLVSSSVFLQYAGERMRGRVTYVNRMSEEHVGFVVDKDSPLDEPLRRAVQKLIDDGTYRRIMAKWGLESSAIPRSQVNPPGLS